MPEQRRRMQVRDVTGPIEAVCRQFCEKRGIPPLYLHDLTRPLLDEVHALMDRHAAEVRADAQAAVNRAGGGHRRFEGDALVAGEPAARLAFLERLDAIIRERNTWHDLRALDAYESLWELAYGAAWQAVRVAGAAREVVEQDMAAEETAAADELPGQPREGNGRG